MRQLNSIHSESMGRYPVDGGEYAQSQVTSQSQSFTSAVQKRTDLLEFLMPEGVSPAKQAIIERLVTLWLADSKLDVA
ncbi:hypothetical protein [Leptothermofonsia sp. ETS-13]|uniref:hypothetical protein n=1 Tax=Leptothermofonsia sp. ETS-13 TaxID=3035696 RepID=UPI003B9F3A65